MRIVDIFHVWRRKHAILLSCKIDEEGERGDVSRGAVGDAHFELRGGGDIFGRAVRLRLGN